MKFKITFFICLMFVYSLYSQDSLDLDIVRFEECIPFTIGENVQTYTARRSLKPFLMAKFETTYDLWHSVIRYALLHGYVFQNPGQEGSLGRRGKGPTEENKGQPVVMISWYDTIVWINALNELLNLECPYTYKGKVIKDSTNTPELDLVKCNFGSNSWRLPTEAEWEYAARYTKEGLKKGDYTEEEWTSDYTDRTHIVGTIGLNKASSYDKGHGKASISGLYDMFGNVLEYCFDWFGIYEEQKVSYPTGPKIGEKRVSRGGSYSDYTSFTLAADRYEMDAGEYYDYTGFRLARSIIK